MLIIVTEANATITVWELINAEAQVASQLLIARNLHISWLLS